MPNLRRPATARCFPQTVDANTRHFGAKGTAVSSVPAVFGLVVNSNSLVTIFDKHVTRHATSNVIISISLLHGYFNTKGVHPAYDPYRA